MSGWLVLVAIAAAGGSSANAEKSGDLARPSFAGRWTLKPEESDDGRAKMKEAMGERRRGGRRGPTGGGPMGGGPGGGPGGQGPMSGGPVGERGTPPMAGPMGGGPDPEQMAAMREAMDAAVESPESLLISQDGVAFEMVLDGERAVRLYADGRKNKGATGVERKTKWYEDRLVTEAKVGGGFGGTVKITETWAIVPSPTLAPVAGPAPGASEGAAPPDSTRLAITTQIEGGPFEKALVIRRFYERASNP